MDLFLYSINYNYVYNLKCTELRKSLKRIILLLLIVL